MSDVGDASKLPGRSETLSTSADSVVTAEKIAALVVGDGVATINGEGVSAGVGLGVGVGFAVGFGVGRGVGLAVGRGVGAGFGLVPVTVNVTHRVGRFTPAGKKTSVATAHTWCFPTEPCGGYGTTSPFEVSRQPVPPRRVKPPPAVRPSHSKEALISQPTPSSGTYQYVAE